MKNLKTLILMMTFLTLLGCQGFGQTAKIGEQFTLKTDETAKIKGTNIEITVNRIGRKWLANGGGESLDFSFSVKHGKKIETYSDLPSSFIIVDDYKIEVVKTEPFGYGYAIFVVTKTESVKTDSNNKITDSNDEIAAKFLEKFGWNIDETVSPTKTALEFPENFNGLPFYHYQIASQNSGIDMTPLLGKKVEILRYTLKEKQTDDGKKFEIYAHLIIENEKIVGAWRTDSSPSAPGIYSFVKKKNNGIRRFYTFRFFGRGFDKCLFSAKKSGKSDECFLQRSFIVFEAKYFAENS